VSLRRLRLSKGGLTAGQKSAEGIVVCAAHTDRLGRDKQDIKVRLVKPGLLEIEWPRSPGEEIPVE